jgi:hypothetical protein
LGIVQGQLKARRKELAQQNVFAFYFGKLVRRTALAR